MPRARRGWAAGAGQTDARAGCWWAVNHYSGVARPKARDLAGTARPTQMATRRRHPESGMVLIQSSNQPPDFRQRFEGVMVERLEIAQGDITKQTVDAI